MLAYAPTPARADSSADGLVDTLLHQKSHIFAKKLDVLAAAMLVRTSLMRENLFLIEAQRARLEDMLLTLDRHARYHMREQREKTVVYQALFALDAERRSQAVECWRDVVLVIRDFLEVWEAHQQSQARARFLEHVGS